MNREGRIRSLQESAWGDKINGPMLCSSRPFGLDDYRIQFGKWNMEWQSTDAM